MSGLRGRTILLGVTGGIAAYKSAEIVRWLRKEGATVVAVLTPAARRFISPLTLETLSANPVVTSLWRPARGLDVGARPSGRKSPVEHVEIADSADLVLVAPATADFLAKAAVGLADDPLLAALLATAAPLVVCPSMNVQMWNHPATQMNLATLLGRGVTIVTPEDGDLACGWEGRGRLASLESISAAVLRVLGAAGAAGARAPTRSMAGRRIVVTAGPTREALDPVRYLTNHSSGKMGYALAEAARDRGATVTLISGPTSLRAPADIETVPIVSTEEMKRALDRASREADAVVMSAAVADFRPAHTARSKIRRSEDGLGLELVATPDLLKGVPRRPGRVIVGFALETQNGLAGARRKLVEKHCDFIVLNDPTRADSAFGGDTNRVTLVDAKSVEKLDTLSKRDVADRIWDRVEALWPRAKKRARARPGSKRRKKS
jgi:phosphopantothenoylcysteine decarboxylase/phosphopantothenate--cysteine ligase